MTRLAKITLAAAVLAVVAVCALAQSLTIPQLFSWTFRSTGVVADNSVPPTNIFSRAQQNPLPLSGADPNLPENFVFDPVTSLYVMPATAGPTATNVVIYTNGVDPSDPTKWAPLNTNVLMDANIHTPSPCLVLYSNEWYLFHTKTVANQTTPETLWVASNTTPFGPFTNSLLLASNTAALSWQTNRMCEVYVYQLQDLSWVMAYMGDAGGAHVNEQVGYATASSITGPYTQWPNNPLITFGAGGTYDAQTVADPWIVYWKGTHYIGYAAGKSFNPPWLTGMATTTDFTNITRLGVILNSNAPATWDDTNAFRGAVTKYGRMYVLPYAGDSYRPGIAAAPADTDPPTLSNVNPLGFVTNTVVTVTTDIPANVGVMFGTSSGVYTATNAETLQGGAPNTFTPGTWGRHWTAFTSTAGTTYFGRIIATNTAGGGQVALSSEFSVAGNSWNPTNRPNVKVVYDVNLLGQTSGTTISTLTDFTAQAFHAKAVGTAIWCTNNAVEIGNQSFLRFPGFASGNGTAFATNFTALARPNTFYVVMRPVSVASQVNTSFPFFWDSVDAAKREALYEKQNSGAFISQFAGTDLSTSQTPPFLWKYWELQYNGSSSFTKTNGVLFLSGNTGTAGDLGGITLGNNNALNQPGGMDLAFMAIVNAASSASESDNWQIYFINRFGRILPP